MSKICVSLSPFRHKDAIGDILLSSHAELELELKLRHIAEEWSEQV